MLEMMRMKLTLESEMRRERLRKNYMRIAIGCGIGVLVICAVWVLVGCEGAGGPTSQAIAATEDTPLVEYGESCRDLLNANTSLIAWMECECAVATGMDRRIIYNGIVDKAEIRAIAIDFFARNPWDGADREWRTSCDARGILFDCQGRTMGLIGELRWWEVMPDRNLYWGHYSRTDGRQHATPVVRIGGMLYTIEDGWGIVPLDQYIAMVPEIIELVTLENMFGD
jgi:hypothetical protein